MSYEQFGDRRQQFRSPNSLYRVPEEQEQHQPRNGMKRPRGYSPPGLNSASDPPNCYPVTKRLRRVSGNESLGMFSSNFYNNNNGNNGGLITASKSDDEVSLAEEVQTTPTSLPHHSIFMQDRENNRFQQPAQLHQQQHQSQLGYHQVVDPTNGTNFPSGSRSLSANRTSYATDYQPMNNLLGNLHLMRQQRRQTSAQSSQEEARTRNSSAIISQQQQNHYHRHYGMHQSLPKPPVNSNNPGTDRSRRKTVSLRVTSNLY